MAKHPCSQPSSLYRGFPHLPLLFPDAYQRPQDEQPGQPGCPQPSLHKLAEIGRLVAGVAEFVDRSISERLDLDLGQHAGELLDVFMAGFLV
jgi:hypothetical protein